LCIEAVEQLYIPLIAMGAAICFASGQICSRMGLNYGTPTTAIAVSLSTSTLILSTILGPLIDWDHTPTKALWVFALAGVLSPFATQILLFVSAAKVGISRASPLRNTTPLFAGLVAVLALGETLTVPIAVGTLLIISGASLLGMKDSKDTGNYKRIYLVLPVTAALLGGFSSPMRKFGYSLTDSVPFAICLVQLGAFVGLVIYLFVTKKYRELVLRRETLLWFGASGVLNSMAVAFNMTALEMGDVVVVSPLIATTPLFTVLFTFIFLRSFERVTPKVVIGAGAICLGGIVLTAL
jgi:drug/metabolite transporter (DMT)-like permease